MSRRVDTANRTVLALLGLLLLGGGAVGLAASFGSFGDPPPVLPGTARRFEDQQPWFWWAVAGVCLLVALLALRWLLAQLHTDRVTRLDLTRDDREGRTVVHAGALTAAVEEEAQSLRGVVGASARLVEARDRPHADRRRRAGRPRRRRRGPPDAGGPGGRPRPPGRRRPGPAGRHRAAARPPLGQPRPALSSGTPGAREPPAPRERRPPCGPHAPSSTS